MITEQYLRIVNEWWDRKRPGQRYFRNVDMHHVNPGAYEASQNAESVYDLHVWKYNGRCWTVYPADEKSFSTSHPGAIRRPNRNRGRR